jgi:hypothetical protein
VICASVCAGHHNDLEAEVPVDDEITNDSGNRPFEDILAARLG